MIKRILVAPMIVLLAGLVLPCRAQSDGFVQPRGKYAGGIPYPITSVGAGLLKLIVHVDSAGHVTQLQTVRDLPSLTAAALVAVRNWVFLPAEQNREAIPSDIAVDVLFNPGNASFGPPPPAPSTSDDGIPKTGDYVPPEVRSATYGVFPIRAQVGGTVVLDVRVSSSGRVTKASAIYTTPSLTHAAAAAVKKWRFTPATLDGRVIPGHVVVAFVFRTPTLTTPYGTVPTGF